MIALDLFAGHGWGVACQKLGIEEYGVEIMPEAIATRELNGMTTIYNDVWTGLEDSSRWRIEPDLLIASPPCQTFSMAGGGAGRKALDDVLGLIDAKAYRDVAALRAFGESHDPRTALVLTPLAHVYRDLPRYVVFEQVPPVLPVWERCAEEMRAWGYSVWTGNLQAEMYGVPQTRKRAILIAKRDPDLDGEAAPPVPTYSRYYSRDPKRLDEGVLPWVSMAEALGWGMTERPFITAGNAVGRAEGAGGSGGKAAIVDAKERGAWRIRTNQGNPRDGYFERDDDSPSPTVTGVGSRSWNRVMRSNYGMGGDASNRGERVADEPSATITSKADRNLWTDRPATTAERVTVAEAAALQSYPPGFTFAGTKTKQFLQVGNAVPPLLAEAILRAVIS